MKRTFGGRSLRRLALSLFATLVLALGLCPAIALADEVEAVPEGTEEPVVVTQDEGVGSGEPMLSAQNVIGYPLMVGGMQVTEDNKSDIPAAPGITKTGTASYDPNSKTLTLANYSFNGDSELPLYGIMNDGIDNLTIELVGDNKITGERSAIFSLKSIVISGSGTLTTTVTGGSGTVYGASGIWVISGNVTISGGTVNAIGARYGIMTEGGDVTISGGTVVATGENEEGISTRKLEGQEGQSGGGNVKISGGTVTATGLTDGIRTYGGDVEISGGTVTATGGKTLNTSCGILTWENDDIKGNVTISGKVTGTSVTATGNMFGIWSQDVTISGGTVVAEAIGESRHAGIYVAGNVTISGGDVTAHAQGKSCINGQDSGAVKLGKGVSVKAGKADPGDDCTNEKFEEDYYMYAWARTVKAETYTVTVDKGIQNGTVSVDKTEAAAGESVKVTAKADEGYELDTVTVKDADGKQVETKDGSFTMPASDVTVSATFTKKAGPEPTPTPAKPAKVAAPSTVAHPAAGSIDVSWKKAKGAKSYQVQWRVAGAKKWATATVKGTKKTITGLKAGKLYDVRVRGVDGSARGAWSTPARQRWLKSVSKAKAKPGTSKGSVKVSWKKDKSANAGYKVLVYAKKGGKAVATKTVSKSKTSATITNLKSGKTYYVRVRPLRTRSGKTYVGALCGYRSAVAK